jgi:hypothetical protein
MYFDSVSRAILFETLFAIDSDLADACRDRRCPRCGGPLHDAHYERKPRGGPAGIPEHCSRRLGLCCGRDGCRHRVLPPSCLFLGRTVYWAAIVLVVVAARQRRPGSVSAATLRRTFGVSWETVKRWMSFFADVFPRSEPWRLRRGLVPATVRNDELPAALLELFVERGDGDGMVGMRSCLEFLVAPPLGSGEHAR